MYLSPKRTYIWKKNFFDVGLPHHYLKLTSMKILRKWPYLLFLTLGIADIGLFIAILTPYALVVYVLKMHRRHAFNRQILGDVEKAVRRTALMIATAILFLYSTYFVMSLLRAFLTPGGAVRSSKLFAFFWLLSIVLLYVNSAVKPLIFLRINDKCRQKVLGTVFGRCGFTGNRRVDNERTTSVWQ